jgi:hypothetical protein
MWAKGSGSFPSRKDVAEQALDDAAIEWNKVLAKYQQ